MSDTAKYEYAGIKCEGVLPVKGGITLTLTVNEALKVHKVLGGNSMSRDGVDIWPTYQALDEVLTALDLVDPIEFRKA